MRIVIATPLYPPDIAEPAPYVKELATRIKELQEVTILAYNYIPEKIQGVKIIAVPKYDMLPVRLIRYTFTLWKEAKKADYVYVQNGPSTELPLILVQLITRTRFILRLGDEVSLTQALNNAWRRILLSFAIRSAQIVVTHNNTSLSTKKIESGIASNKIVDCVRPQSRPEVLPFFEYPTDAFHTYEHSWSTHITDLQKIFIPYERT